MNVFFSLAAVFVSTTALAQIPNAGFENINPDNNNIDQWGKAFLMAVIIDSTGETTSDSIVFDDQLYFPTSEAHSGMQAMEMRNAYNYSSGQQLAGGAILAPDNVYAVTFAPPQVPVPVSQPQSFRFWYRFHPVGLDSAMATLMTYDADGNMTGLAEIRIGGTVDTYTLADVPVVYTLPGDVSFVSVEFSTAIPGGEANLGTRFLVDDVSIDNGLGIAEATAEAVSVYPNPVKSLVTIGTQQPVESIVATDLSGASVPVVLQGETLDCSNWSAGVYFLHIAAGGQRLVRKINKL